MTDGESLLNACQITPVSSDPSDADALTPNHFLYGSPNFQVHSNLDSKPQSVSKLCWMDPQEILNHFWNW